MSTKRNLVEAIYPLSPMQQGMLFHTLYDQASGVYLTQINLTLRGNLDVPSFQRAWELVIERHPVLRTAFVWERRDEPFQVVYRQVRLPWSQHDLRDRSPDEQEAHIAAFLADDLSQGFALDKAPLMRLVLFQTAVDTHQFLWSQHHLLMDGWSLPLVIGEVFQAYEAFAHGRDIRLPAARPYREYIAWLQKQDMQQAETFWRENLAGFTAPTPLGVDQPLRPDAELAENVELEVQVPSEVTIPLQALTRQHGLTLNTVVQGAWALLLSCYSGERDVVFGATVSGRPADLPGVERMVGLFINTLPVRITIDGQVTLLDWLKQIQTQQAELRQYEYSPLVQVQGWSEIPRGQSLFESLVVFENYPTATNQAQPGNQRSLEISSQRSLERGNYPLNLTATTADGLGLRVTYDGRRFTAATIERLVGHLQTILAAIAAAPMQHLREISLLRAAERQLLLHDWTATAAPFPTDRTLHALIEDQAVEQPDAPAVVWGAQTLSYGALNARANQLAHVLRGLGVGPETRVGVGLPRSLDLVVGLLAVLKAGGAYLPLDPSYPQELLRFMLADAEVTALLTVASLRATLPAIDAPVLCLDTDAARIDAASSANPASGVTAEQLAYVIYTSGSTGQPKGVAVAHRGVVNLALAQRAGFAVEATSRLLQFASINFDASVSEVAVALTTGAELHLLPSAQPLVGAELAAFLTDHAITHVTLPPSVLATLPEQAFPDLHTLVVAGEACSVELMQRWADGRRFVNAYGPTETTVCATLGVCHPDETEITIGRALANTQVYVLDATLQPVPVGVVGELYVAGVGLARGYLQRADLTAERFVPNPFVDQPGARLYRTGDRARYQADGRLVFVGRADSQLKLRGYRIEPEQIAAQLRQHPDVADALVIARAEHGEPRLVAYVVTEQKNTGTKEQSSTADSPSPAAAGEGAMRSIGGEGLSSTFRDFLSERVPAYMLPSAVVTLDQWPLTPNGKIDRKALPAPEDAPTDSAGYVAPQSPSEELLAGIWAEVLRKERVGVHDSFFDLGGHSLLATQVISRVRAAFQVDVPLRSLFDAPTVAAFAARIEALRDGTAEAMPAMEPVSRDQALPLSFAQQRLWFLDQLEPGSSAYAMPVALRLQGALDVAALQHSL
ncbi:MAG: amino acid adenylation domain-containing protein, partial [Chloroflexi bacterium]|nr:amino acid adenylation domain-containing protein [Chloroflexota bacterium]